MILLTAVTVAYLLNKQVYFSNLEVFSFIFQTTTPMKSRMDSAIAVPRFKGCYKNQSIGKRLQGSLFLHALYGRFQLQEWDLTPEFCCFPATSRFNPKGLDPGFHRRPKPHIILDGWIEAWRAIGNPLGEIFHCHHYLSSKTTVLGSIAWILFFSFRPVSDQIQYEIFNGEWILFLIW